METNWSGNYRYRAARLLEPGSLDELQSIVAGSTQVRALGSRHSFSDIADSPGTLVSLRRLPRIADIDQERSTITVGGGQTYGDIAAELSARGFALANLASLPHISVAGAVSTGTHGSGVANRSLSAAVTALEFVGPQGELRTVGAGEPDFDGSVVALGALGIVTRLTLAIEPHYEVRQDLFTGLPWHEVEEHFDTITSMAYSVSLFTRWRDDGVYQVWVKSRGTPGPESLLSARRAEETLHMFPDGDTQAVTGQLGELGSWEERLPHFRMAFTPSRGDEIQSEYLIPRTSAQAAFAGLRRLGDQMAPILQTSEIRTVAADQLWLSPASGRDTVGLHFTWSPQTETLMALLPAMEEVLLPLGARPHWGKVFSATASDIEPLYPHFADFRSLRDRLDPLRTFGNDFLERVLGS